MIKTKLVDNFYTIMIELISKNYEWIFSGIGVLILTLLINPFKNKKSKNISTSHVVKGNVIKLMKSDNNNIQIIDNQTNIKYENANNENNESDFANIDPVNIKEKIQSLPLYQQDDVANHYLGLRIKWILLLSLIIKREGNIVLVIMVNERGGYPSIEFEAEIDKYPILKIANKDELFEITGKIIKCERYTINIELETLKEKNQ